MDPARPEWTHEEMATLKELSNTHTSTQIAALIGRTRGAVQAQANRKGIPLLSRDTATFFGRKAEQDALKILKGSKLITLRNYHAPYDLLWQGHRVNVKSAMTYYNRFAKHWYWTFRIKESWVNCDMFLLLGYLRESMVPKRAWLVPSAECRVGAVGISQVGTENRFSPFEIGVDIDEISSNC